MLTRSGAAAGPSAWERAEAIARLTILVAIIAAALLGAYRIGLLTDAPRAKATIQSLRQVRALPFWFVAVYALTATIGVPPLVLTLAGGAVFGTKFGVAYSWIGALLGAIGGYAIARSIGGDSIRQLLGRRSVRLDHLLTHATFGSLFRLRVNPIVPFNVLNFASGMSKVPLRPYLGATVVGILPATVVYAYFADSVIAGAIGARERAFWHIAGAGVVMILLSFGPATWNRLRPK